MTNSEQAYEMSKETMANIESVVAESVSTMIVEITKAVTQTLIQTSHQSSWIIETANEMAKKAQDHALEKQAAIPANPTDY